MNEAILGAFAIGALCIGIGYLTWLCLDLYVGHRRYTRDKAFNRHGDDAIQLFASPLDPESRWMLTDPFDEQGDLIVSTDDAAVLAANRLDDADAADARAMFKLVMAEAGEDL